MVDSLILKIRETVQVSGGMLGIVSGIIFGLRNLFAALLVLILIDLFTGIWRSKKEHAPITSKGLRTTVEKTLSYFVVVIACVLIDVFLMMPILVSTLVLGYISFVELYSICENITKVTGIDFIAFIKDKITKK